MEILVVGFCIPGDTPGENIFFPFGEHAVYGLDIAVEEGEEGAVAQQVWHGDANNATDTSHFGTILLVAQPAVAP